MEKTKGYQIGQAVKVINSNLIGKVVDKYDFTIKKPYKHKKEKVLIRFKTKYRTRYFIQTLWMDPLNLEPYVEVKKLSFLKRIAYKLKRLIRC